MYIPYIGQFSDSYEKLLRRYSNPDGGTFMEYIIEQLKNSNGYDFKRNVSRPIIIIQGIWTNSVADFLERLFIGSFPSLTLANVACGGKWGALALDYKEVATIIKVFKKVIDDDGQYFSPPPHLVEVSKMLTRSPQTPTLANFSSPVRSFIPSPTLTLQGETANPL
eukprot:Awhi_evm1s11861